ncbi:MAG: ABC transporter ATP-binding protein [Planctomycetaceae bacterium]|nr:ABC transporter ATP-binding protein [Planctomycetaceae bacterium]
MDVYIVDLVRQFGKVNAVDHVTFSFGSGQIFGFVGPNGAGKTTTMRILATLDEPTSGDIFVGGKSVTQYPDDTRRLVGFMPDTLPEYRDITVHEYLDFFARAYKIRQPRRRKVIEQVEEFVGLIDFREKTLAQISKGMKQRVSLARAIVHEPEVLVLDEPANGLDPRARIELRELLKALRDQGKAILISSHILTELGEICDGVVFIERGKLLHAGSLNNIISTVDSELTYMIRAKDMLPDVLQKHLLEMPLVSKVRVIGNEVAISLAGTENEAVELFRHLYDRQLPIVEFRQHKTQLEDLFMRITKGNLQ